MGAEQGSDGGIGLVGEIWGLADLPRREKFVFEPGKRAFVGLAWFGGCKLEA